MGHFEDMLATILTLSPLEKVRLMEQIATSLEHDLEPQEPRSPFILGFGQIWDPRHRQKKSMKYAAKCGKTSLVRTSWDDRQGTKIPAYKI